MLRLYDALITPIMSYGCEIWGFKEDRDLEKVEIKFIKPILHLPDSTPTMAVRGELGQLPIFLLWKERILKYWNRLCSENIPIFLREAASLSLHNATAGKQSWAMNTASIFNHASYSSSFFEGNGCDHELTNRLMSVYSSYRLGIATSCGITVYEATVEINSEPTVCLKTRLTWSLTS